MIRWAKQADLRSSGLRFAFFVYRQSTVAPLVYKSQGYIINSNTSFGYM